MTTESGRLTNAQKPPRLDRLPGRGPGSRCDGVPHLPGGRRRSSSHDLPARVRGAVLRVVRRDHVVAVGRWQFRSLALRERTAKTFAHALDFGWRRGRVKLPPFNGLLPRTYPACGPLVQGDTSVQAAR